MRLLLVAWWCAAVLPGLSLSVFFTDAVESGDGFVVPVWILGFIAQLLLFMVVSRELKGVGTTVVLWFVVSLLPFAIDWGLGIGWAAEIAFVLLAVVVALFVAYRLTTSSLLQRDGIRATAVVLEVKKPLMNVVVNDVYIKRRLRVRVKRDDQAPSYEATYSSLWEMGTVPEPGDTFRVVVDARRPQHLDALDERTAPDPRPDGSRSTHRSAEPGPAPSGSRRTSWRFTSWGSPGASPARRAARAPAAPTSYPPYDPPPVAPDVAASARPGVVAALQQLADLHEKGQLTDDEFAQAKRELLGGGDSAPAE